MSAGYSHIGGSSFNHQQSSGAEAEYERLRDAARQEQGKYQHCSAESRKAYERGDGGGAKQMSQEGKQHAQNADNYNKQASDYIFRENNAVGRVASDTIDLHGQYVTEAETIIEQRIRYAQQTGQTHLHVIVGKGNHSPDHIQKIKPKVEEVCQELGLKYSTEHNEGRMYIDLTGGAAHPPTNYQAGPGQYNQQQYGKPNYQTAYPLGGQANYGAWSQQGHQQQAYGGQQQAQYGQQGQAQYGQQQQQQQGGNNQQALEMEQMVEKNLPKILQCLKGCCTVM